MVREGKQNKSLGRALACRIDKTCIIFKIKRTKQCSIKRTKERLSNVSFVRENVLSLMGKEGSGETEKTEMERYTLLSMGVLL